MWRRSTKVLVVLFRGGFRWCLFLFGDWWDSVVRWLGGSVYLRLFGVLSIYSVWFLVGDWFGGVEIYIVIIWLI